MSKYNELKNNPPKLKVVKDAKEIVLNTVSVMCDNKHMLRLKKNEQGEFKLSGCGHSLSNWQMECSKYDIEWAADEGKWNQVFDMINTGTSKIASVKSR